MGIRENLTLTIRYRTQEVTCEVTSEQVTRRQRADGQTEEGWLLGRNQLAALLCAPREDLMGISETHLTVVLRDGRYWMTEGSSNFTNVRTLDAEGYSHQPYREVRRGIDIPLGHLTELELRNDDRAGRSNNVVIVVSDPTQTALSAASGLWGQLLRSLAFHHVAHLTGLPGAGKHYLMRQLKTGPNDKRGREILRHLGVAVFPIEVDCQRIASTAGAGAGGPPWQVFAQALLLEMGRSAYWAGYPKLYNQLEMLSGKLEEAQVQQRLLRPDQLDDTFDQAFKLLIESMRRRPLLMLGRFDDWCVTLDPAMLDLLAEFTTRLGCSPNLYVVIATAKPLVDLRADLSDDGIFRRCFEPAALAVNYYKEQAFDELWNSLGRVGAAQPGTKDTLRHLTGGNAGLLKEIIARLEKADWPRDLTGWLDAQQWAAPDMTYCRHILNALTLEERHGLACLAHGHTIPIVLQKRLERLGLIAPPPDACLVSGILQRYLLAQQPPPPCGDPTRRITAP